MRTVGLLVGRERTFPDALIREITRRDAGVVGMYAQLDITNVASPPPYDVLIDRISHEITCYQPVLKVAALGGTRVVNNPFWRIADDKAFGTALAAGLGVPVPKTFVLPSKSYSDDVNAESLHNLRFPLDWQGMVADVGFPLYMKPHWGGGFRDVYKVNSLEELWSAYDNTGRLTMIVQENIEWEQYVRCVVIGKSAVLPLLWNPKLPHHERYTGAAASMAPLSEALTARVVEHAETLCRALGYDMNTCEFGVRDGVPYAIDFMNSAPDFEEKNLPPETFRWIVEKMADLSIKLAHEEPRITYRWDALLAGRRLARFPAAIDRPEGRRYAARMLNPKPLAWGLATLVSALVVTSSAHADTKVAVVDMQRSISETNEGARATDALKKLFDKRQVELDGRQNGLLKEKSDLEKRCKSAPKSDCEKGMEDLQKKLMELQGLMSQYQGEIQKKQGEATQPILVRMLQIVKRIALDKGFDVVVDRGAAHWMRADLDVTELAIKMYNSESNVPPLPPSAPSTSTKPGAPASPAGKTTPAPAPKK